MRDRHLLQMFAAAHPDFPHSFYDGLIRIGCPSKCEYISSSAFGEDRSFADVCRQPVGVHVGMMLLTACPNAFLSPGGDVTGRWYGHHVITAWAGTFHTRSNTHGGHRTDWYAMGKRYFDISREVQDHINRAFSGLYATRPEDLRRMIYSRTRPPGDDFSWLTVTDLWNLRYECRRRPAGTWRRLRRWLMRCTLSDEARRALGGRPGRLRANQRRTSDQRDFRHIRTTRRKGEEDATV